MVESPTCKDIVRVSKKESGNCILKQLMSTVMRTVETYRFVHACSGQNIRNMVTGYCLFVFLLGQENVQIS